MNLLLKLVSIYILYFTVSLRSGTQVRLIGPNLRLHCCPPLKCVPLRESLNGLCGSL